MTQICITPYSVLNLRSPHTEGSWKYRGISFMQKRQGVMPQLEGWTS